MKITIYIFSVFLSLTFTIFAEKAKACAYHSEDSVVILLNQNTQNQTGSFITFLSTGLDSKNGESFLGIDHVDYKIDDQQLYRYSNSFEEKWSKVSSLKSYKVGPWLALVIPKKSLLISKNKLTWRVALFPKGKKGPTKLPSSGPSHLNLQQPIKFFSYQGDGLPLDITLAATCDKNFKSFTFRSGETFELPKHIKPPFSHNTASLENLSEPVPNTLFFDSQKAGSKTYFDHEIQAAHRVPNESKAVFFELPQLENSNQNTWLNNARSLACYFSKKQAYFQFSSTQNLPSHASGGTFLWKGELKDILTSIKSHRKKFEGPLWYYFNIKQNSWDEKLKTLSYQIWNEYNILPMLEPKHSFESIDHHFFTEVLWQKKQLLLKQQKTLPIPQELEKLKPIKLIAPEIYLNKVNHLIDSKLVEQN